jgi:hypothetical protein
VERWDLVFVQRKNNHVLRLVLTTDEGTLVVGRSRQDEGERVARECVLGRVARIEKVYAEIDPLEPAICYDVLFDAAPPVEAWGDYRGHTFAFRAKYDWWEFQLSTDPLFPATDVAYLLDYDLAALEEEGTFPAEEIAAARSLFVREGTYGKQGRSEASYMSRNEVLRLVRECIAEYLASTE